MKKGLVIGVVILAIVVIALAVIFSGNKPSDTDSSEGTSIVNLPDQNPVPSPTPTETISPQTFTVEITSSGFSPKTLEIKQGDTVVFVNKDSNSHWPASAVHPTHTVYPGSSISKCGIGQLIFDACKGLAREESFSFKFDELGSWNYHDHLNPGIFGAIKVS